VSAAAGEDPRIERLGPGVTAVVAENPGPLTLDGTRTYVIGRHRVAIVDPGPVQTAHLDRVASVVAGRPVAAVCLTHSHSDHAAAAVDAAARWGLLRASADALARLGVDGSALADGEAVTLGEDESLVALSTPGHSGDHLAYLHLPDRELFTGDLVLGAGSSMVAYPDGSVREYIESLTRLLSLDVARLLPGHGPPVDAPAHKLEEYRAHRLLRTHEVRLALDRGPTTRAELRELVYGVVPDGLVRAADLSLLAHLEHAREQGYPVPTLPD
jgi:glyoxylase-like metal-dependent hydrolase (beta-lactamase superfamily II)